MDKATVREFALQTHGVVYGPWDQAVAVADEPMDEGC